MACGAALFFASDMILAWGLFRGPIPRQTELVWLTYGPGQMLIVFGALAAGSAITTTAAFALAGSANAGRWVEGANEFVFALVGIWFIFFAGSSLPNP